MPNDSYYDLPPSEADVAEYGSKDWDIIQWCEDRLRRGIRFVESQTGYDKIDHNIREIFSYEQDTGVSYIPGIKTSSTRANLVAKIGEDLTAMLTDTRYFWKYFSYNEKYEHICRIENKSAERWYNDKEVAQTLGVGIKYYTVAGTAFFHFSYSPRQDDLDIQTLDPRNVFPVDPPIGCQDLQKCAGVISRVPQTPEWIKQEYGKVVAPDNIGVLNKFFGWLTRSIDGPGERGGPLSKKSRGDSEIPGSPTTFVNTMYIQDRRKNKTSKTVRLGPWEDDKPMSQWSYEVKPGLPLYPFGRMIVWGGGALLYDGPSPYWHGDFPILKLTLNPWPWSWFGKAPITDCVPLNDSINRNLRVIDDHAAQVAQPAMIGDRNVSKAEMNKANTRAAGMKIRTNMASGKGIQIVPPPPLDSVIWEVVKWCQDLMQKLSGTADPSSMASLNQIPSDDTIDTIMKAMTPGVRLRSRILESFYTRLAKMFLYNDLEFGTITKRFAQFGVSGITKEDFDFDPGTMIPDDVPDGEPGDIGGSAEALALKGPRPQYQRCLSMLASFSCKFDPSSLLNSAGQQELMKYFLLAKMGYVSVFTLMEKMGIMNFAPEGLIIPPDEIGRLQLQQSLGIGMVANAQGRKATDSAPPSMGQNSNGPTIQTS
jgi:hypothetical protein